MSNGGTTTPPLFPRSFLFVPANQPRLVEKALGSPADAIIVDLEDSVPLDHKSAGRSELERMARSSSDSAVLDRVFVRINGIDAPWFDEDLRVVASIPIAGVVLPKVERPADVSRVQDGVARHRSDARQNPLAIIALLETPLGILKAADLAVDRPLGLMALAFGAEDYRARMGVSAADAGALIDFARVMVTTAAAAAGVPAIDTPEVGIGDMDRLRREAERARQFGFRAKFAIHPAQIATIHEVFAPTSEERDWAQKVLRAYDETSTGGRGATALDGQMIDAATVLMAQALLARGRDT